MIQSKFIQFKYALSDLDHNSIILDFICLILLCFIGFKLDLYDVYHSTKNANFSP